jgi:hypothetical protein
VPLFSDELTRTAKKLLSQQPLNRILVAESGWLLQVAKLRDDHDGSELAVGLCRNRLMSLLYKSVSFLDKIAVLEEDTLA